MKRIKDLTLIMGFGLLNFGRANEERKSEILNAIKARALSGIDERIADLQKTKTCLNSATTREALKACREAGKQSRQSLREENKKFRQDAREKLHAKREGVREERRALKSEKFDDRDE